MILRLLLLAVVAVPWALACSCFTTGSACTALGGTGVVFVGLVTEDSGEGWGTGPGKMQVEEVFRGLAKDIPEVTVDTSAGTSCYMRLEKGERYVIYGVAIPGNPARVHRNACSFSFKVAGNEALVAALREAAKGNGRRLVGKIQLKDVKYGSTDEGAAGVRVVATLGKERLETLTLADGQFEFLNIGPGKYHLSVASEEFFEDDWRWPKDDPSVSQAVCGYQNLYVWPNGMIEGTVRSLDGKPLPGIAVQAFGKDRRGALDSSSLREAKTDENGRYSLHGLPPGEFVIGVNGAQYEDRSPWPPRYYPGTADRDAAARLQLTKGQRTSGIDLVMGSPRVPAKLYIETVFGDGTPVPASVLKLESLSGVQRVFHMPGDKGKAIEALQAYVGETYTLKAIRTKVEASAPIELGKPIRMRIEEWRGEVTPVQISSPETRVRVVLHPVQK